MIKASALYIVIVIALVIALLCSSLIGVAYFYRLQYQQKMRYDVLENNLESAINILLKSKSEDLKNEKKLSLFNGDQDSVSLKKQLWGIYEVNVAQAFIRKDTLFKVFTTANLIDSTKWTALYVIDEDRPLSVSGKTIIHGNAFIPKAGIREAYVDNKAYQGEKKIISGQTKNSEKKLPPLSETELKTLEAGYLMPATDSTISKDSMTISFRSPTKVIYLRKNDIYLSNLKLSGNIILRSDSTVTIDSTCHFRNILIFSKSIHLKSGFKGTCQLFARDSINLGSGCTLLYPSCLGIVRSDDQSVKSQEKISIGENSKIDGVIFTYEKKENEIKPFISCGKNVKVYGNVYSQGLFNYQDGVAVYGSIFTNRFLYQTAFTRYENYLINLTLDAPRLSRYYLISNLLPVSSTHQKVLQWLESN